VLNILCLTGKFSESHRQPVSSITAVEDTRPSEYAGLQSDTVKTSVQPRRIDVIEPDYMPGLDMVNPENQIISYRQSHPDIAGDGSTPRKEFGTQTGMLLPWLFITVNLPG